MQRTRGPGSWTGLITILTLAGALGPAAGRGEEGAPLASPLLLRSGERLIEADGPVTLAGQILWSAPDRIFLLGLVPRILLAIEPRSGGVEVLADRGPGPFDISGPVALLAAGATPRQVFVLQPGARNVLSLGTDLPALTRLDAPATGCIPDGQGAWWLGPVPWDPAGVPAGRVQLHRGPAPGSGRVRIEADPVWIARHRGSPAEILTAQYFTRLLRGPGSRLWRVVLGERGRADLVEPESGRARRIEVDPAEGAWIEASVDRRGHLHLLVAGGPGSWGRRVLRFAPEERPPIIGDRDWNTGAIDPSGERWVAVEAASGAVLVYDLPVTRGPSNR